MSSSPATPVKHHFLVYAPDKTEPGTLERRLSVRESHLAVAKENIASGFIRVGGMMTTPEAFTNPDAPKKMVGSALICEAETIEQVRKMVEADIYYTSGVWDPEKIVILPFFAATAIP
ncbi:hypothetical protein NLJ89_g373 [Agrocybe chaxingu]|uniref:YCII-related domain-containing protein n=1 Tax=Agrocybe chaxingu TaxID=84603 RepID=A0A9W8N225_9AGAR|nr:hypothetical protein NLJ89_g373 [Agrocybe chaxingu]